MFDLTINLGNLLTIIAFIGGAIALATSIKSDMKVADLKYTIITATMDDFKQDIKKLAEVITQQALDSKRMDYVEERQMSQGKRLDEAEKRLNLYADSPIYQRQEAGRP